MPVWSVSFPWTPLSCGRCVRRFRSVPDQLELVPPDTTVGEVVVVVGAVVVVVVGDAVVAVAALDPDSSEDEVDGAVDELVDEAGEEADDEVACIDTALLDAAPGISLATRPPKTAAVSAAPPVAIPVARLTLRMAADLCPAWSRGRIGSSSVDACSGSVGPDLSATTWQSTFVPLGARCE